MKKLILLTLLTSMVSCITKEIHLPTTGTSTNSGNSGVTTPAESPASESPSTTKPTIMPKVEGVRTGSGGDGIACYSQDGQLDKVYLWDLIEAEIDQGLDINYGDDTLSVEKNLDLLFKNFLNPLVYTPMWFQFNEIKETIKILLNNPSKEELDVLPMGLVYTTKNPLKFLEMKHDFFNYDLADIKDQDSFIQLKNSNCKLVQVAITNKKLRRGEVFVRVNKHLYEHMPNSHKAALLTHEFFLLKRNLAYFNSELGEAEVSKAFGKYPEDTKDIRYLIAQAASNSFQEDDFYKLKHSSITTYLENGHLISLFDNQMRHIENLKDLNNALGKDLYRYDFDEMFLFPNSDYTTLDMEVRVTTPKSKPGYDNSTNYLSDMGGSIVDNFELSYSNMKPLYIKGSGHTLDQSSQLDQPWFLCGDYSIKEANKFDNTDGNSNTPKKVYATFNCLERDYSYTLDSGDVITFKKSWPIQMLFDHADRSLVPSAGYIEGKIEITQNGEKVTLGQDGKETPIELDLESGQFKNGWSGKPN